MNASILRQWRFASSEGDILFMRKMLILLPLLAITIITIALVLLGPGTEGADDAASVNGRVVSPFVASGNGKQAKVTVVLTWYGFNDNSAQVENQHGSADIGHPRDASNPTLHNLATEGKGTFHDPITFAARNNDQKTFPIGSVIYVPLTHKYYIMEDTCGDNDPQGCLNGTHHVDLWMGPQSASNDAVLGNCEDKGTPGNSVQVIINPCPSLPVDTTPEFKHNKCTLRLH